MRAGAVIETCVNRDFAGKYERQEVMQYCRNSHTGLHKEGPPDKWGHVFCIYCGQPLVRLQSTDYNDSLWFILILIIFVLVVVNYLIRYR